MSRRPLRRAVRIDSRLDGEDAARGERLAGFVVAQQHRLLDARGNLRFSAEHVGDRPPEDVASTAVPCPLGQGTRPLVDVVRERLGDGENPVAGERTQELRVGDCFLVICVNALLREVR